MRLLLTLLLLGSSPCFFAQQFELYKKLPGTEFNSASLGYEVNLEVTVPIEFDSLTQASYPVVLVFDMQNRRSYNYILNTIDYLTVNDQMPSCVVVGITSGEGMKRYYETQLSISDSAAYGEKNEAFIFEELLPLVRKEYQGNQHLTLIGHSRYGYFTSLLLTRRPKEIGAVVSLSPFLTQKNVNLFDDFKKMTTSTQPSRMVYYRLTMGGDFPEDYSTLDSMLVREELTHPSFDFKGTLFPQAGHTTTPGLGIAPALYEIFEFWSEQQLRYFDNSNTDFEILASIQREITQHYGQELNLSLGILNGKGWFFYGEEKYNLAIKAWEAMMNAYPNFSDGYLNIAYALQEMGQDPTEMLDLYKESLAKTTFYSAEEKTNLLLELTKEEW